MLRPNVGVLSVWSACVWGVDKGRIGGGHKAPSAYARACMCHRHQQGANGKGIEAVHESWTQDAHMCWSPLRRLRVCTRRRVPIPDHARLKDSDLHHYYEGLIEKYVPGVLQW